LVKRGRNKRSGNPVQPSSAVQKPKAPAIDVAALLASHKATTNALITRLEAERNRPTVVYWLTTRARMSNAVETCFADQLESQDFADGLDLVLHTTGGDTEVPIRLVNLIREKASTFTMLVPSIATSSGTLFALGANEIQMGFTGSLGPIDPSRNHPLLPKRKADSDPEPVSVQDMRHAMTFIRESVGDEVNMSSEAWAQIFAALFDKIHPLAIGAIEQAYALSKLVAKRCLESHMDAVNDAEEIERIIDTLCDDYKSHEYRIARSEAKQIGLKVVDPAPKVEEILRELYIHYQSLEIFPTLASVTKGTTFPGHIGYVDSIAKNFVCAGKYTMEADGRIKAMGDNWEIY